MESIYIIRRPLLTEKSTIGMNEHNQFSFEVDRRATKADIKKAVEDLYNVHVVSVNTQVRKGLVRRIKQGYTQTPETKRAVVRLRAGEVIELI